MPGNSSKFIFIGGLHRSGTTILASWLAEHPAVSGLSSTGVWEDEGQHLQQVYPTAGDLGGVGRFGKSSHAHLTETSPLVSDQTRECLLAAWTPYWDLDRPMLLEKSPPNLLKTRFLQALFPESYFIMVIRHPIAVAHATQKWIPFWNPTRTHSQISHWLECYEALESDAAHLSRLAVSRYEDLVADPGRELARLHAFLGIEPIAEERTARPGLNDEYFRRWLPTRNPLKRAYVRAVATRFEQRVSRFGYSLLSQSAHSPQPGATAALPMTFPESVPALA